MSQRRSMKNPVPENHQQHSSMIQHPGLALPENMYLHQMEMMKKNAPTDNPILQAKNLVNHIQSEHPRSALVIRQDIYKDEWGDCALDIQVCPNSADPLGISGAKPVIGRKTIHLPPENAEELLRQNTAIAQQNATNSSDVGATKELLESRERKPSGELCIAGRLFNFAGPIYTEERLYQQDTDNPFFLEVTIAAKLPDMLDLQTGAPCISRMTVPLSEIAADAWMRQTGAHDQSAEMNVRIFRLMFTDLDPHEDFDLPARYSQG